MTRTSLALVLVAAIATPAAADVREDAMAELTRKETHAKRSFTEALLGGRRVRKKAGF